MYAFGNDVVCEEFPIPTTLFVEPNVGLVLSLNVLSQPLVSEALVGAGVYCRIVSMSVKVQLKVMLLSAPAAGARRYLSVASFHGAGWFSGRMLPSTPMQCSSTNRYDDLIKVVNRMEASVG